MCDKYRISHNLNCITLVNYEYHLIITQNNAAQNTPENTVKLFRFKYYPTILQCVHHGWPYIDQPNIPSLPTLSPASPGQSVQQQRWCSCNCSISFGNGGKYIVSFTYPIEKIHGVRCADLAGHHSKVRSPLLIQPICVEDSHSKTVVPAHNSAAEPHPAAKWNYFSLVLAGVAATQSTHQDVTVHSAIKNGPYTFPPALHRKRRVSD